MSETNILVVEDEGVVALSIQNKLEKFGYSVPVIVATGWEAIEAAEKIRFDLVLMDIMLEGDMDGVEATRLIQERFNLPVVYLTAHSDEATLQRAKITEPFGYILKPFEERELHIIIEMALYKYRMEHSLLESKLWFNATLKSIGDAVIATDNNGCIKFMNPIAEILTGWQSPDAVGKSLEEVVDLIDINTQGSKLEPIMEKLRKGVGTDVLNDTRLITKQGSRLTIEGCITPIRNDIHLFNGGVLVFRDVSERNRNSFIKADVCGEN